MASLVHEVATHHELSREVLLLSVVDLKLRLEYTCCGDCITRAASTLVHHSSSEVVAIDILPGPVFRKILFLEELFLPYEHLGFLKRLRPLGTLSEDWFVFSYLSKVMVEPVVSIHGLSNLGIV